MILATRGRNRELFAFDSSVPIPRPSQWGAALAWSGERVTMSEAVSLPAFLRGVRLISETSAGLPLRVFRGYDDARRPVPNAPQQAILRRPNPDCTPFTVWSYVFASLLQGNAYLWKIKVNKRLTALYPICPKYVTPKYDGARPTFDIRDKEYGPVVRTVGRDQIIHIPGILLDDPYVGISVVEAHRHGLGSELGRQKFEGRYIANDARPGTILRHEGNPTKEQRDEVKAGYQSVHGGGPINAGRVGMVWGGWEVDTPLVSLQDAQFIESKRFSVQEIARMLGVPPGLLGDPEAPGGDSPEHENMRFLKHGLQPWMDRLEQGLACDPDLFPESDWDVAFDTAGFIKADIQTRWNAYRLGRQGGWITANEVRGMEGLEKHPDGDQLQETPVGGAPNSNSANETGDANAAD